MRTLRLVEIVEESGQAALGHHIPLRQSIRYHFEGERESIYLE